MDKYTLDLADVLGQMYDNAPAGEKSTIKRNNGVKNP
jgi:hypothetical protein